MPLSHHMAVGTGRGKPTPQKLDSLKIITYKSVHSNKA